MAETRDPRPLLLLLPGLHGTEGLFSGFAEACPASLRAEVVAFPTDQPLRYSELVEHVLERAPAGAPLVLLGESFSGPLALMLAARLRPRAVILSATFYRSPMPAIMRLVPWSLIYSLPAPLWALRRGLCGGDEALARRVKEELGRVHSSVLATRAREILHVDATEALRACPAPILYLRATEDALVGSEIGESLLAVRPDAEVVDVEAPHLILQTRAEASWAAIQAFLTARLE